MLTSKQQQKLSMVSYSSDRMEENGASVCVLKYCSYDFKSKTGLYMSASVWQYGSAVFTNTRAPFIWSFSFSSHSYSLCSLLCCCNRYHFSQRTDSMQPINVCEILAVSGKFGIIWNKNIFCSGIKSNWNTNQRLLCSVATLTFPLSISLLTMSKCSPALFLTQPMAYLSIIYVAGQMCWKGRCCLLFLLFLRYSLWCWAGEFNEIQWAFCSNKLYELCSKQRVSQNNGKPILFSNDILSAFSFHTFEFGIKTMSRRYWKSFQE